MNPLVTGIFQEKQIPVVMKTPDDFGGLLNFLLLNNGMGIYFIAILILAYILVYPVLSGRAPFNGLIFSFFIILIKVLPEAFNQWMLFHYPVILILIQLINASIDILLFGFLISILFEKSNAIQIEEKVVTYNE